MVDLDSGVYLRTNRIELLSYLMILCPLPTFLPFHIASASLPSEEFTAVRGGWGESCICAVQLLAVTSLGSQCPWAAFGVCFYTAQWAPGSSSLPQSSPSASPAPHFFSQELLHIWNLPCSLLCVALSPSLSHLNSECAQVQPLLISGFVFSLFINLSYVFIYDRWPPFLGLSVSFSKRRRKWECIGEYFQL